MGISLTTRRRCRLASVLLVWSVLTDEFSPSRLTVSSEPPVASIFSNRPIGFLVFAFAHFFFFF